MDRRSIIFGICGGLIIAGGSMIGAQYTNNTWDSQAVPVYIGFGFIALSALLIIGLLIWTPKQEDNVDLLKVYTDARDGVDPEVEKLKAEVKNLKENPKFPKISNLPPLP